MSGWIFVKDCEDRGMRGRVTGVSASATKGKAYRDDGKSHLPRFQHPNKG